MTSQDLNAAQRRRLRWVQAYQASGSAGSVCRRFGVSRPTLRKWLRRYEADGEVGVHDNSRRPHRSPRRKADKLQVDRIVQLRHERPLGVKRIRNELQRLHGTRLSAVTIHKVLVRHHLNVLPRCKRVRDKPKRYNRPVPGDRLQMDTCKIRPGPSNSRRLTTAAASFVGLACHRSAAATLAFLDRVLDEMPVAIQRIETDRGTEFFAEDVQRRLMAEGIRFRPLRPRSPHLNGKVE